MDYPVLSFSSQKDFREWLSANAEKSNGIWLLLYRKDSGVASISHEQALDESLCYGWIDGQAKKKDEKSWFQKFTPRRGKSMWSKRNIEKTEILIRDGKMTKSGFEEIERAKKDGRWDEGYNSPKNFIIPQDFLDALSKDKSAEEFFNALNKANRYAIAWRLQTAKKPETRVRRMKNILEMMKKGEKFY
jgi:uncharacterized protein YdeI (YjbR/CyaY-like superfamily)